MEDMDLTLLSVSARDVCKLQVVSQSVDDAPLCWGETRWEDYSLTLRIFLENEELVIVSERFWIVQIWSIDQYCVTQF